MAAKSSGKEKKATSAKKNTVKKSVKSKKKENLNQQKVERKKRIESSEIVLAVLAHLFAFVVPLIGVLIIFLVTESSFVKEHARSALNFSLSYILYSILAVLLIFPTIIIGVLLLVILMVLGFIFPIVGAIRACEMRPWVYPGVINFL